MITISTGGNPDRDFLVEVFKFPSGEINVRIDLNIPVMEKFYYIRALDSATSDDIMSIILTTDALRSHVVGNPNIILIMPYVPYARQDRVCNQGESLSVKVLANLLNSQNYYSVVINDPHSDVTPALINNSQTLGLETCFKSIIRQGLDYENAVLVAPDAGANKKVFNLAKSLGLDFIRADKVRDTKTGTITGTNVYTEHLGHRPVIVVDDICDGGRTFIELSKVLQNVTEGRRILYVTHGIFSQGLEVLLEVYDEIWVYNPFVTSLPVNAYTSLFGRNKILLKDAERIKTTLNKKG